MVILQDSLKNSEIHEFTGLANTCNGIGTGAALVPL